MGLKKLARKAKRSVKKISKTASKVVKNGLNSAEKSVKSNIRNVKKLIGLKRKQRRQVGLEGTVEDISKLRQFTGESKEVEKVTVVDTFSGLCFNGTKSNFDLSSPQCYDFDDNFIHFSSSMSEKYDTDTDEFIDLDLSNSFIDPTKKYPIRTIGTKYVGSGIAGLATGGKTCDDIECVAKPNLCSINVGMEAESSIIRRAYEFNNITWIRRDDMPEGVAFHTGVGDEENAIFWGGLHASIEAANLQTHIPGCDNWDDIITSFQGEFNKDGFNETHLVYSKFRDSTETNYGVTFTPIQNATQNNNYEIYDENLVETFDISESLEQIDSGNFSLHGGKISYTAYEEDSENIKVYYDTETRIIPKEVYIARHDNLCNILENSFNNNFTEGVLLAPYINDDTEEETILINLAIDKNNFSSPYSSPSNVAESEDIDYYWQVMCMSGDCLCECNDDAWLQYDFVYTTKVIKYEITVQIVDAPIQFTPKEWILVGSDNPTANKEDWDTLDSREDIETWSEGTTGDVTKIFEVTSPKTFKHYRLYFNKSNDGFIRVNQLKLMTYVNPSVWLWTPPYNQTSYLHYKDTEDLYIQPSTMVISGSNLEVVRSIKKSGNGARVSRAVMAGPDSTGIGSLNLGLSNGYHGGMPFDYGDVKKVLAVPPPDDTLINNSFPWNVIGDNGIVGPTGMVEMIDINGNYWVAFGDSENKNVILNKDSDFINKYTIIMITHDNISKFIDTVLAYENYSHSKIQQDGFLRKDWTNIGVDESTGTYISLKGSRNREGFLEIINSRIGDELFDVYVKILDYNVTDPSNNSYTDKEINSPDPSFGIYDPTFCEVISGACVENTNYFYFNDDSRFYPILINELVSPGDSNCNCNFCSLENVLTVDSSGNPFSFDPDYAPYWKQHNHTEWATSYLESPFSGPFSREKFNVWLTAGHDPKWGTALWSTVDKGEAWMHFRKTRFAVDEPNNNLVYMTISSSFNMDDFTGSYASIPVYVTYDEFIFDLEYYRPLREVQRLIERDTKDSTCDDTLLTYVNPNIFLYCSEPKEIDIYNIFVKEPVSQKNTGRENSIEINYTDDISGGAGFHSQSPFMVGPIEDDVIVYAGSVDGDPLVISGELTIVKGNAEVEPAYPFKSEDIVYRNSGGFSISEFGIDVSAISGTDEEIPSEDNENLFDEQIQTAESSGNRLTLGQRLILGRYRSSFGMKRSRLNRRYPWLNSYFDANSPVYADFSNLSDRQRRIVDKYFTGNNFQRSVLRKRHPWLKSIKSPPITTEASNVIVSRIKRSIKRGWRFFRRDSLEDETIPTETPSVTGADSPTTIISGTELFTAQKGAVYWLFFGLPDGTPDNSYNIYASGKMYYTPKENDVQVDLDPDTGYTEWTTCFVMEYKKRDEDDNGYEKRYYYRYNVEDKESNTLLENEEVNQTNKDIIETDWRRFQDGVGLGGGSVPILNNRFPTDIKCTNPSSCGIGSVAFGDPDQAVICGGYKNNKDGVLIPTRSWWGLTTDMPTFKWNRFVINPEDTLNSNYRRRNFSPFYNNGEQTLTDSIHSCILFDVSRPQTFERHGQIIFDNETEKEVLFEDFPEYVEEKDKYSITLLPTGNIKLWWSDKGDNKFTINSEIEWKGTVDWKVIKVSDIPVEKIEEMEEEDTFEEYEDQ